MKKIYLICILLFTVSIGFSQIQSNNFSSFSVDANIVNQVRSIHSIRDSGWTISVKKFNYAFKKDSILGNIGTASSAFLWPDTTVLIENPDSSLSQNPIFAIGEYFDPNSMIYFIKAKDSKCIPIVYLDTIGFYCIYERSPLLSSAVDTLVLQIKEGGAGRFYWEQSQNPWVMLIYGTDTLAYKGIYHDSGSLTSSHSGYKTWKFPLDSNAVNDTLLNGLNYFRFSLNYYLGDLGSAPMDVYYPLSLSISFVPGFTWAANVDTLQNLNRLRFISFQENGDNAGVGTYPSYSENDWNCSYILYKDKFLNDSLYTPSYYFDKAYAFEHHWIDFILRIDQTGGFDKSNSVLKDVLVSPNPFSVNAYINYYISRSSDVELEIYDLSGSLIYRQKIGTTPKGAHKILINGSKFNQGLYFYVLKAGKESKTGKIIFMQ